MDAFIGEIRVFPFVFAPVNYMACQGQLLPINQYTALYAIIGTTYGGNGTSTFALPDLRSYAAVGVGAGTGLTPYVAGEVNGSGQVNLTTQQIPSHSHVLQAGNNPTVNATTATNTPSGSVLVSRAYINISGGSALTKLYATTTDRTTLAPNTVAAPVGAIGAAHDNHQPYLALQYCICVNGIYPVHG